MKFTEGPIDGIIWKPLKKFHDARGWLCEMFRHDELPPEFHPVMCYISATEPGVARGRPVELQTLPVGQSAEFAELSPLRGADRRRG